MYHLEISIIMWSRRRQVRDVPIVHRSVSQNAVLSTTHCKFDVEQKITEKWGLIPGTYVMEVGDWYLCQWTRVSYGNFCKCCFKTDIKQIIILILIDFAVKVKYSPQKFSYYICIILLGLLIKYIVVTIVFIKGSKRL